MGHSVTLHGCVIGDECLIGMGATVLSGAKIRRGLDRRSQGLGAGRRGVSAGQLVDGCAGKSSAAPCPTTSASAFAANAASYVELSRTYSQEPQER